MTYLATKKMLLIGATCLLALFFVFGESFAAESRVDFLVEKRYDFSGREEVRSSLVKTGSALYFYVDEAWWNAQAQEDRSSALLAFADLDREFQNRIQPIIRNTLGSEWTPGIDQDSRLFVLFHPMEKNGGGYMRLVDEYPKLQLPHSNEREMVYLNTDFIGSPLLKSFLAHEYVHLVTFNEKTRLRGTLEDVWLNEARAEYGPTLLGYDSPTSGSNLENRMNAFQANPTTSLVEWRGDASDYGAASLFVQYLVDQYGKEILKESLFSPAAGKESIEDALKKRNVQKTFEEIFSDWLVALLINDCTQNSAHCYSNAQLKDFRIVPQTGFLPLSGEGSSLLLTHSAKEWGGNWHRFVGGSNALEIEFRGDPGVRFRVSFILQGLDGSREIRILQLADTQEGKVTIEDFSKKYRSLTLIPYIVGDSKNHESFPFQSFSIRASSTTQESAPLAPKTSVLTENQIQAILTLLGVFGADGGTIQSVEASLRGGVARIPENPISQGIPSAFTFEKDLQPGATGKNVQYLQMVLNRDPATRVATNGPGSPGQETETFGPLTREAVIRFQELYAKDILSPWSLSSGTGFVGPSTRRKMNELLANLEENQGMS